MPAPTYDMNHILFQFERHDEKVFSVHDMFKILKYMRENESRMIQEYFDYCKENNMPPENMDGRIGASYNCLMDAIDTLDRDI